MILIEICKYNLKYFVIIIWYKFLNLFYEFFVYVNILLGKLDFENVEY